jgi:hypothetical protein
MRTMPLQFLTWGPITAAVVSAAWLSSTDQGALFCSVGYRATSRAIGIYIPVEPTRAGSLPKMRGASEAKQQLQASAS